MNPHAAFPESFRSMLAAVASGLAICAVSSLANVAHAGTYYVDSGAGNDALNGRAAAVNGTTTGPWRSLARLARASLQPGDRIVLTCGSVWRETLRIPAAGTLNYPIVVGMPTGGCTTSRPTIDGSVDLPPSAWRFVQGQIYQAQLPTSPLQLYSSNGHWTPASHPNRGYDAAKPSSPYLPMAGNGAQVTVDGRVRSTSIVIGSELKLPPGGAVTPGTVLRVRTNAWTIEERRVTANMGGKLLLDNPTGYTALAGWGYFLMGQAWMVDSAGEWHHDPATGRLLASIPGAGAPIATISAAVLDKGVDLQGASFVQLDGLVVRRVGVGLMLRNTRGVQVRGTLVQETSDFGADATGSSALTLDGNVFMRTGKDAVQGVGENGRPADGMIVRNNNIRDSGVVMNGEDIASLPIRSFAAIYTGPNATVEGNNIVNSGYIGIRYMLGSKVERNIVYGTCSVLDDCGAIYTWGTEPNNSIVRQNIVSRVRGNLDGKPANSSTAAQGIYLDDYTTGVLVEQNTVVDADNGIQVHLASGNVIRDNVLYNNRRAQLWMQADKNAQNPTGDVAGNTVSGNLIAPVSATSVGIRLDSQWSSTSQFGTFSRNRYLQAITSAAVQERTSKGTRTLSFKEWQTSKLVGSTQSVDTEGYSTSSEPFTNITVAGGNLITNGQFSVDNAGWSHWNQSAPSGQLVRESCTVGVAGRCLRYWAGGSAGLMSSPNFSVRQGQWYRLSVDVLADQPAQTVSFIVRRGGGGTNGYESLSDRGITFNATNTWRRFTALFQATKTVNKADPVTRDLGARIDVEGLVGGKSIALTNIELVPVTVAAAATMASGVVNSNATAQTASCPVTTLGGTLCGQLARLSDGIPAAWPMLLPAYRSEVLFARNPALVDTDRDGIADVQDICPSTPADAAVNAAGCAPSQR